MTSMMPRGYGIGPSGKLGPLQPPTASNPQAAQPPAGYGGDGFGGITPLPNPAGNSGGYVPAGGMPPAGGGSVDTGGLPSGPDGGGGGFNPTTYSPTFGGDTYNTTTHNRNISTYRGGDRDYSRTYNQQKTNIDNSTTMAARGGQQRQKIERMRPFKQKDYGMGEQMIGDPGQTMQQLRMMKAFLGQS